MSKSDAIIAPVEFEPEFVKWLTQIFEESIVFNQILGLKIIALKPALVKARIKMKPNLVGYSGFNTLHVGVISAGLETVATLAAMAAIGARHMGETPEQHLHRYGKLSTIDLQIDYLRPGNCENFELSAEVIRFGSRVVSTRMEFLGANGQLLATGAGSYILS